MLRKDARRVEDLPEKITVPRDTKKEICKVEGNLSVDRATITAHGVQVSFTSRGTNDSNRINR